MKKTTAAYLAALLLTVVGCSRAPKDQQSIVADNTPVEASQVVGREDVGEQVVIGTIRAFGEGNVHLLTGDTVGVYDYDNTSETFYLGQNVQLAVDADKQVLKPYIRESFENTHTSEGDLLFKATGKLTEVASERIVMMTPQEQLTLATPTDIDLEVGTEVSVDYALIGTSPVLMTLYNESTKLVLAVDAIERADDGEMVLQLRDADNQPYICRTKSAVLEVNLSELKVGDVITVYHDGIMESMPMQLDATLIRK